MPDAQRISLYRQARAAIGRGDWTEATGLAHELVRRDRRDPAGLILLAEIAHATERLDEELDCLERAVRLQPRDPRLREHLGKGYAFRGAYAKALAQFDKMARLDPGSTDAAADKAQVYQYQNKWDRARRLLAPVAAKGTPSPRVALIHLRSLVHDGDLDEAIALGRAVLAATAEVDVELRGAAFELARALERKGEYAEAIETATRANAMLAAPFDAGVFAREVDALIEISAPARLAALPRPAAPSEVPIFIVGVPRCGSTLVERLIASHPDAHGAGEIRTMLHLVRDLPVRIESTLPYPACVADLDQRDVDTLSAAYVEAIQGLAPAAQRVTNKDLGNYLHLGLINVLFPSARVIHCRRDPVDTCLSCFMQAFAPSTSVFTTDLRSLGLYYRQYERLMAHYRAGLDLPFLEVDYETLVTDQEAVTRRIIEFCGLTWHDACLRPHEAKRHERTMSFDQVRRPMYGSSIGRGDRFGARLDPLRRALAGEDDG